MSRSSTSSPPKHLLRGTALLYLFYIYMNVTPSIYFSFETPERMLVKFSICGGSVHCNSTLIFFVFVPIYMEIRYFFLSFKYLTN
jgi:hypothetical protein